ncbi:MAG: lipooligosaccharide sialyltransferase [Lachnospiraceae bacterium]|nr:lipooligosaccharide sialyltransferase [Lachnospiraceae bacterium]
MSRAYVCHTFYHVYVSYLKECALRASDKYDGTKADVLLSTLCTEYGDLQERMMKTGFWNQVYMFHEKYDREFPELKKYKKDRGNIVINMLYRIRFTKKLAKCIAPYVPVDMKQYDEIYVFCDSDPIGYYLNANKIYYHAMEDGLNCMRRFDGARYDNRGAFKLKEWMAKHNLIFIQNGHSKYCIDYEVNDKSLIKYDRDFYIEVPRKSLVDRLTKEDKEVILRTFIPNLDALNELVEQANKPDGTPLALILTEPLCAHDIRKKLYDDMIEQYCQGYKVVIKPHPRDTFDYVNRFPDEIVLDGKFPMELMNFIEGLWFEKTFSVLTEVTGIEFSKETKRLGVSYLDLYEDPMQHRYNDFI